jgi:3-oxoadipate enol-lactonase
MSNAKSQLGAKARTRDGVEIVYDLRGELAAPKRIALVHSLAQDRGFWDAVAAPLAGKAAVLAYDCRGHGQSGKPAGPYTAEQFADDLADIMDQIGWKDAVVAGCSMGGCVALAFGINHGARTKGLGLIDTTAWYGADAPKAWGERADAAVNKGLASLAEFQLTRWFSDAFRTSGDLVVNRALKVFLANDIPAYAATCRMLGAVNLESQLGKITAPTRIVVGEEDYAATVAMSQTMKDGIAGSTMLVLEKARHLTPLEVPGRIVAELEQLL